MKTDLTRRSQILLVVLALIVMVGCRTEGDSSPSPAPSGTSTPVREVNVRALGAKADGSDDRPAIQAALDQAAALGLGVYVPAGIYVLGSMSIVGDRVLRTHPNQVVRGDGALESVLKVGNRLGPFTAAVGAATDGESIGRWTWTDLGLDLNARGGNIVDTTTILSKPRMGIRLGSYDRQSSVVVRRSMFRDASALNVIYAFAATVRVSENQFLRIGGPAGGTTHDHSTVYTSGAAEDSIQEIDGNYFEGVSGSGGSRSAIDTHGGHQVIRDNFVKGFLRGMNLTGQSPVLTRQITVERNTVNGALIGIEIWAHRRGSQTGVVMENVVIRNNSVALEREAWQIPGISSPSAAVMINQRSDASIDGLLVAGNTFTYPAHPRMSVVSARAAAIECKTVSGPADIRRLAIIGNHFIRSPAGAIGESCQGVAQEIRANRVSS